MMDMLLTGYVMALMWIWGYAFDAFWWQAEQGRDSYPMAVVRSFVSGLCWPVILGHEAWTRWGPKS